MLPVAPGSETLDFADPADDSDQDTSSDELDDIVMQISGFPTDGSLSSSSSRSSSPSSNGEESPRRVFESVNSDAVANRRLTSTPSPNDDRYKDSDFEGFKRISNAADKDNMPPSFSASSLLPKEGAELAPKVTSRVQVGTPNDVAGVPVTPDPNNLSAAPTFLAPCFLSPLAPGATVASSTSQQVSQSSGLSAPWPLGASGIMALGAHATPKVPILLAPKPVISPVKARGSALPPHGAENKSLFALEEDENAGDTTLCTVGFAKRPKKCSVNSPFRKVKPAFELHMDASAGADSTSSDFNECASPQPLAVSDLAAHVTTGMSPLDVLALSAESSPRADTKKCVIEAMAASQSLCLDFEEGEDMMGSNHKDMEGTGGYPEESPEEMAAKAIASFNEGYRRGYALGIRGGDPAMTTEALHKYYNDDEDGLSAMPRARGFIQYDSWASPWPNASIPCSMWGSRHNSNNHVSMFDGSSQSSRNSVPTSSSSKRRRQQKGRHVRRPVGKVTEILKYECGSCCHKDSSSVLSPESIHNPINFLFLLLPAIYFSSSTQSSDIHCCSFHSSQRKPLTALKPSATFGPFTDDEKRALGIPVRQSGGNSRKQHHHSSNGQLERPPQRAGPRPPPTPRAPLPPKPTTTQASSSRSAPTRRPALAPLRKEGVENRPSSRQPSGVPGLCEVCQKPHNGSCGSGRFCSIACRNRCNGMKACKIHRAAS